MPSRFEVPIVGQHYQWRHYLVEYTGRDCGDPYCCQYYDILETGPGSLYPVGDTLELRYEFENNMLEPVSMTSMYDTIMQATGG